MFNKIYYASYIHYRININSSIKIHLQNHSTQKTWMFTRISFDSNNADTVLQRHTVHLEQPEQIVRYCTLHIIMNNNSCQRTDRN